MGRRGYKLPGDKDSSENGGMEEEPDTKCLTQAKIVSGKFTNTGYEIHSERD